MGFGAEFRAIPFSWNPSGFDNHGADGFALMPSDTPGSFEDFTRLVMPELRRRGRVPELSNGQGTLRERLGLTDRTR